MRLRPRVHVEDDLVLWCRVGGARVVVPGGGSTRTLAVAAGSALLLRAGQRHTVEVPAGTLLHPVFLPPCAAPGTDSPAGNPAVEVDRGLAAALLTLSVAGTTDLRPAESRLRALGEAVRSRMAGGPPERMHPTPASHIEWVTNQDEHVLVLAVYGPVTVMVRDEAGACAAVDLAEHMALAVPPGAPHRILTREAGVALPVFHHGTGLSPGGAEGRVDLMYLPARLRLLAEHHAVAGSSALRPRGFDETALPHALTDLVQRTSVLRLDGGAPAPVDLLRERVMRDPAGSWSPATGDRLAGVATLPRPHRRTLERAIREATGTGFVSWRNRVRAEQAEDLLASGLPVKTVARRMGFAHASGFSRAFHQATGTAPASVTRRPLPGDLAPSLPLPAPPRRNQTRSRP